MEEFFIELYSEEIPFGLQKMALSQTKELFEKFWNGKSWYSNLEIFVTPTRIVLHGNMNTLTNEEVIEKKGPQSSASEDIINNFLKANSISKEDCYKKQIGNKEYLFFKVVKQSDNVENLMPEFIRFIIENFKWPKSMRWGISSKWIRPIRNIYTNLGGKFIKTPYCDIPSENIIRGHKLIGKSFVPTSFKDYVNKLKDNFVILDASEKYSKIMDELSFYESDLNIKIFKVDDLITEHVGINDYPTLFISEFDPKFLSLPKKILTQFLITSLKVFPVFNKDGDLLNKFIGVANITKTFYPKKGSTKFLNAKLADATFFFEKDMKTDINELNSRIKSINYYNGLGSIYDRVDRIYKLAIMLKNILGKNFAKLNNDKLEKISSMMKMDLGSLMVFEYPELQGIVGSYIAKNHGFDEDIVLAISEQYYPESEFSDFSGNLYSIVISLADKIEKIVSFFNVGVSVSGSRDPLGLRRSANSIITIIEQFDLDVSIEDVVEKSYKALGYDKNINICKDFIFERFFSKLSDDSNDKILIRMIIDSHKMYTIPQIFRSFHFLKSEVMEELVFNMLPIYKRVCNLCDKKYKLETCNLEDINNTKSMLNDGLFESEYEHKIFELFSTILSEEGQASDIEEFYSILLKRINAIVSQGNDFFDNVMINSDDERIKNNRLILVLFMRKIFDSFLNFSLLL